MLFVKNVFGNKELMPLTLLTNGCNLNWCRQYTFDKCSVFRKKKSLTPSANTQIPAENYLFRKFPVFFQNVKC